MSDKNKVQLIFEAFTSGAESKLRAFGSSAKGTFSNIGKYVDYTTQKIGFMGTALTALSTGVVLKKLFSVGDFIPIDRALLMMQANLRMTAKEIDGFKTQLSTLAGKEGEDMTKVFATAQKLSVAYKPEDILKIMEASAKMSDATEEDISVTTDRLTQLMKIYRQTPGQAKEIADSLVASRLDLESLDVALQRSVMSGGAGGDYKELLALFAGLKKSGLDSTRILMRFEGAISALFEKSDKLKALGINPFKIDSKTGAKVKKNAVELLEELKPVIDKHSKRLGEDKLAEALDKVFGEGAGRGIPYMISQLDKLKKAREDQQNAAEIAGERQRKADETWGEQLSKIKAHLAGIKTDLSFIYDIAKKPVKFFAENEKLTKGAGYGAAGLELLIGGGLVYKKGKDFFKGLGSLGKGVAAGKALEAVAGITPVFVTNWPSGITTSGGGILDQFGRPIPTTIPGAGGAGGIATKFGSAALIAGKIGAAGAVGYAIGTGINKGIGALVGVNKQSDKWYEGGVGGWLGEKLYDLFNPETAKLLNKNSMPAPIVNNISIQIDKEDRVTDKTDNMNTKTNINALNRGIY